MEKITAAAAVLCLTVLCCSGPTAENRSTLAVGSCSTPAVGSCSTPEAIAARREKHKHLDTWFQSELVSEPYVVTDFPDLPPTIDWAHPNSRKPAQLIVEGSVKEVESYGFKENVDSDVILQVNEVLKNETGIPVDDELYFTVGQGMTPRYGLLDERYEVNGKNPMYVMIFTGDVLYQIGMKGIFLLDYSENRDGFVMNWYTDSAYLQVGEDQYAPAYAYKYLVKEGNIVEYPHSESADDYDPEKYVFTREEVKGITELENR